MGLLAGPAMGPGSWGALDERRMAEALALADEAVGLSDPNPRVGCVLGFDDGRVIGRGHTQPAGQAHAEAMALRDAAASGADTRGATAWVTLEPCAHHGRTPPCSDALIGAGISRVVLACADPFPAVAGRGAQRLQAAGIEVQVAPEPIRRLAIDQNIGFHARQLRGRPWVRLKLAASLDGRTALANGVSQWITGEEARTDGHRWRRRAAAVVTGIGTVLGDDPRLDVRLVPTALQPLRVVMDRTWRTPLSARVLAEPGRALVVGADRVDPDALRRRQRLSERALTQAVEPAPTPEAVAQLLQTQACNEVHVEAGATLSGAWLRSGLVDEILVYLAPLLLGPGRPLADLPGLRTMEGSLRWTPGDLWLVGSDAAWRLINPASLDVSESVSRMSRNLTVLP